MNQMLQPRHYNAWQLIKLYWQSDQRFHAYLASIVVIIMTICLVGLDVAFSYWSNYFYNALQAYDKSGTLRLLFFFCVLAVIYIIFAVYRYYLSQLFGLRWRRWLTEQCITRWLKKRDYYYLENFDRKTDNPDQRIQEDVGTLVTSTISLALGIVTSLTTFFGFIYVLWELSGVIRLPLGYFGTFEVQGYLVWVAIIYAGLGTFLTFKIGYPLIGLNFEQQRREANFRFAAIDLRSHSEDVAFYRGEHHQKNVLHRLFNGVLENWYFIILRQKLLLWFTAGYNQIAVILPLLVALPNYFGRVFLLGGVMQSMRAFGSIQDALSFLVNAYPQIAEWRAVAQRLTTFLNHLQDIDEKAAKHNHLVFSHEPNRQIVAKKVSMTTPQGESLLENVTETFKHGQNYLIKGASGIGKSTFIRVIAGIWPYAGGEIILPSQQKIMYLPQKPYMPIGTLAEAISFPDKQRATLANQLEQALRACHLEYLVPRLAETATWSEQLSPGELQRIAFARVLLHHPDWVFLDESTSMLDLKNEAYLYQLLKERLPDCSLISVGHRPSLGDFHEHVIDVTKYSHGRFHAG